MSYRVSTIGFEGPFDLLLQLVMRQKVDIGSVSVASIADQYLAEVERLGDLDLEVATDFIVVASALLEIKAASLLPLGESDVEEDDELMDLTPDEMREVLVARLVAYRQFKSIAASLLARYTTESRMHPRTAGPDPEFLGAMPDYLASVDVNELGRLCAGFLARRERLLLESEHIAARRVPLETRVEEVDAYVRARRKLTFDELVEEDSSVENKVVSLLALLELSKRNAVRLDQPVLFGTITIEAIETTDAIETDEFAEPSETVSEY